MHPKHSINQSNSFGTHSNLKRNVFHDCFRFQLISNVTEKLDSLRICKSIFRYIKLTFEIYHKSKEFHSHLHIFVWLFVLLCNKCSILSCYDRSFIMLFVSVQKEYSNREEKTAHSTLLFPSIRKYVLHFCNSHFFTLH